MAIEYKFNKKPEIPGWKSEETLWELSKILVNLPTNANIVELGAGLGRATWTLAKNSPIGSTVYAIDLWNDKKLCNRIENIHTCYNCTPYTVITLQGFLKYTEDCNNIVALQHDATKPIEWDEPIHMVFFDATDDYYDDMMFQFEFWSQFMIEGGIYCGDDYYALNHLEGRKVKQTFYAVNDWAEANNKKIISPGNSNLWFLF